MAFYDDTTEEEQQNQSGTGQAVGAPSSVIGAGGAAPGGATEAQGSTATAKPDNFVGITKYLDANKPQSEKLAGQVAGQIDKNAGEAETSFTNAQNSFNQAADSQKVNEDADLLNQVKTNASSIVSDPNKVTSFTKMRDAAYTGPQRLEDQTDAWGDLQTKLKAAQDSKNLSGTEEGRMGLIKQVSNNPRQSQGALTFDNLLLQSNPNAAGKLQAAGGSLNDINDRLAAAGTAAQSKAAEVAAANAGVKANAANAVTSGFQGLRDDLASRESAKDAEQLLATNQLKQAARTNTLSPEQLQQLGLSGDMKTYGVSPSDYINYKDGADIYGVAGQDDIARQAALQSLAGNIDYGSPALNPTSQLGQLGSGYEFNNQGFSDAASAKKNDLVMQIRSKIESTPGLGLDLSGMNPDEILENYGPLVGIGTGDPGLGGGIIGGMTGPMGNRR